MIRSAIRPSLPFRPRLLTPTLTRERRIKIFRGMSSEEEAAKRVTDTSGSTIFDKIISKEISASILHEDDVCIAFEDVNPQAPVHFLVIPKSRDGLTQLSKAEERHKLTLGHLMYVAQSVATKVKGLDNGFRVVVNDGRDGCQSVYHLHLHVMGGRPLGWPPG